MSSVQVIWSCRLRLNFSLHLNPYRYVFPINAACHIDMVRKTRLLLFPLTCLRFFFFFLEGFSLTRFTFLTCFWCDPASPTSLCGTDSGRLNIAYFFTDRESKHSGHFNRLPSILSANGSACFHSTILHTLRNHPYLPEHVVWKDCFVIYMKVTVLEVLWSFRWQKAPLDWEGALLCTMNLFVLCPFFVSVVEIGGFDAHLSSLSEKCFQL